MSFEALAAVDDIDPPSSTVMLLLFILASYAGPDGSCFVSQETLAERAKLSVRGVRENLKLAEAAGLIVQTQRRRRDGSRSSNRVQLTFFTPKVAPETSQRRARGAAAGTQDVVIQPADTAGSQSAEIDRDNRHLVPRQPAPGAGLTTFEPVIPNQECSGEHSQDASVGAQDGFEEAWAAYPTSGLKRTAPDEARRAWRTAVANVGANGAGRLLAAVKAMAADPDLKRGDFGAPSMQRWLVERRWLAFLPADEGAGSARGGASPSVAGLPPPPTDLRASFAASFGEAFARSWWAQGWRAGGRELVTATRIARDRLRRDCAAWLAEHALTVLCAADLAGAPVPSRS